MRRLLNSTHVEQVVGIERNCAALTLFLISAFSAWTQQVDLPIQEEESAIQCPDAVTAFIEVEHIPTAPLLHFLGAIGLTGNETVGYSSYEAGEAVPGYILVVLLRTGQLLKLDGLTGEVLEFQDSTTKADASTHMQMDTPSETRCESALAPETINEMFSAFLQTARVDVSAIKSPVLQSPALRRLDITPGIPLRDLFYTVRAERSIAGIPISGAAVSALCSPFNGHLYMYFAGRLPAVASVSVGITSKAAIEIALIERDPHERIEPSESVRLRIIPCRAERNPGDSNWSWYYFLQYRAAYIISVLPENPLKIYFVYVDAGSGKLLESTL